MIDMECINPRYGHSSLQGRRVEAIKQQGHFTLKGNIGNSMKKILILICLLLIALPLSAQQITNFQQKIENGRIVITYDLTGNDEYIVTLNAIDQSGNSITPIAAAGDIGNIKPGRDKTIYWEPRLEGKNLEGWKISLDLKLVPKDMVFVKGGSFEMGQPDPNIGGNGWTDNAQPVHTVTVNDFYIGKYEVTHREYIEFLNAKGVNFNGSYSGTEYIDMDAKHCAIGYRSDKFYFKGSSYANDENCPVIGVTWYGSDAYCKWKGGRLPTEAEWGYAARGGNKSKGYTYSGSNTIDNVAWYRENSGNKTHKVGTKQPNELGIYDMSGNVWEWCSDWYNKNYYSSSSRNNPQGPSGGTYRVLRGGSWGNYDFYCRVANRYYYNPDRSRSSLGFRFVRTP